MVTISVVSNCEETAQQLQAALRRGKHLVASAEDVASASETGLFVVDIDCDPIAARQRIKAITEEPETATIPVLVAASAESEQEIAGACALGATGLLRKPFTSVEAIPETERALALGSNAS